MKDVPRDEAMQILLDNELTKQALALAFKKDEYLAVIDVRMAEQQKRGMKHIWDTIEGDGVGTTLEQDRW